MIKYFISILFLFAAMHVSAQQNIVEELHAQKAGQGVVVVHQDPAIASLLGKRFIHSAVLSDQQNVIRVRGFRVQVYAGNNSRQARGEANSMAEKVKEAFPEIPVYTYFQPPRWLCRVGDFRSIEEAHVAMRKLKDSGEFKEVAIVREQINITIE